jgi:hypothetical protein
MPIPIHTNGWKQKWQPTGALLMVVFSGGHRSFVRMLHHGEKKRMMEALKIYRIITWR